MSYLAPFPDQLKEIEYVRAYFYLECCEAFELPQLALLQLRREFLQTLKILRDDGDIQTYHRLKTVLMPELPSDPVLVRQVQKPAPAMVLAPDISSCGYFKPGQRIIMPIILLGSAVQQLNDLWKLLSCLGKRGLYKGKGRFIVEAVESENAAGQRAMLWLRGEPPSELVTPVNNLFWWLERQSRAEGAIHLTLLSPLRLLHRGKPLFRAAFAELFPFILRRVSALLAFYGHYDLSADAAYLIKLAYQVETFENDLQWQDWRRLENCLGSQNLGGLMGTMTLRGQSLAEIIWIIQLGSLFNFGKGAPYGAGQYAFSVCH